MLHLFATIAMVALAAAADHFTGTAWYQTKGTTMFTASDQFDIFADDDEAQERLITNTLSHPLLALAAEELVAFQILSDEDLEVLDSSVDEWAGFDSPEERNAFLASLFDSDSIEYAELEYEHYEA